MYLLIFFSLKQSRSLSRMRLFSFKSGEQLSPGQMETQVEAI